MIHCNHASLQLPATSFSDIASLKQLILDDNRIDSIQTLGFSNCPQLDLISLQRNGLRMLARNSFESCPKMSILQIDSNNLTNIGLLSSEFMFRTLHNRFVQVADNWRACRTCRSYICVKIKSLRLRRTALAPFHCSPHSI
jgi:Leucine-rich repeat (LRR) protein